MVQRPIRHANEFWDHYGVTLDDYLFKPADLIFFSNRSARGYFPNHIGIVLDEERYIHAPGRDSTKVIISPIIRETIKPVKDLGRVLFTRNPIGFKTHLVPANNPTYRHHQEIIQ